MNGARHYVGMHGLGDCIMARPFIRAALKNYEIYLETPWPQLYADLPVKFVRKSTIYRTQNKNLARTPPDIWTGPQGGTRRIYYDLSRGSTYRGIEECFNVALEPALFDLPPLPPPPLVSDRPIAFVRPVTVRAEWANPARNPRPEYIAAIVAALRPHYHIVNVADVAAGAEWFVGEPPQADTNFIHGELAVMDALALLASSALIIGGVGWILPAAIAARRPAFIVLGGQGGHNDPSKITDPRLDLSRLGFARPEKFCPCTDMQHQCEKAIPDLMAQFSTWYASQFPSQRCNGSTAPASVITR
jgi:hypothetical protein